MNQPLRSPYWGPAYRNFDISKQTSRDVEDEELPTSQTTQNVWNSKDQDTTNYYHGTTKWFELEKRLDDGQH